MGVSELARVNRVQGLALGMGAGLRWNGGYGVRGSAGYGFSDRRVPAGLSASLGCGAGGWGVRGSAGYGFSDRRVTAALSASLVRGAGEWSLDARRAVRDFADEPVVSGLVNSLLAQETGKDFGDYLLAEEIGLGFRRRLGQRWSVAIGARAERSTSVATTATPVRNQYRSNPDLGSGSWWLGRTVVAL